MNRTSLGFLIVILFALMSVTPARASLTEIQMDPNATDADFAQSFVEYDLCVAQNPAMENECFKILWDPPAFIASGDLTVDIEPKDGQFERFGRVLRATFFNGYTGNGPFSREDLGEGIRFTVPIISVDSPDDLGHLDLVELQLNDRGEGQTMAQYTISGENLLLVDPDNPEEPHLADRVMEFTRIYGFNIGLDTDQEVPVPDVPEIFSPAGNAEFVLNPENQQITIQGSFSNMTSDVIGAHLHGPAPPGEIADVIFPLEIGPGGTDGTFQGTAVLSDETLADLLAGKTYINVHTTMNPAGEIRGQIVPEPTSAVMFWLGMLLAAFHCRHKTQ